MFTLWHINNLSHELEHITFEEIRALKSPTVRGREVQREQLKELCENLSNLILVLENLHAVGQILNHWNDKHRYERDHLLCGLRVREQRVKELETRNVSLLLQVDHSLDDPSLFLFEGRKDEFR